MQSHFIIEILEIKDNNVKVWDISQGSDVLIVELYTEKRQQKCPFCRCKTKRVHSYRIQPIQGPVLPNQQVKIVFMDMSKWFKKAVCDVLDHPLIIADRFHFMRQVYWLWMK